MASLRVDMSLLVLTIIFLICLMSMMGCGGLRESNQGHLVILRIMVKMFFIPHNSAFILSPTPLLEQKYLASVI